MQPITSTQTFLVTKEAQFTLTISRLPTYCPVHSSLHLLPKLRLDTILPLTEIDGNRISPEALRSVVRWNLQIYVNIFTILVSLSSL